ncbi:AAA family ATPase (plasmid) [Bradyrhizobium sp. CB82]|uniref:trifunctional serine/threonine-protein kinase/ATP-binding protein/sensor histidine kinase n=1 Tax=Bradyrhizobium sp. CB82 TaxID=3039159 RepID=UPI0024B24706|nr:ATP-binding sensor histidine kinase [Bradyrhizobium sp. CB82]WFU46020.1 AAA family ATPase [Bradyrhizobium sp. CB82]
MEQISSLFGIETNADFHVAWQDDELVFYRRDRQCADAPSVLAVLPRSEHPRPLVLERLAHEYALKDELSGVWAVRPLAFVREQGRVMLTLEDPGGCPLEQLLGVPMEIERFLALAVGITATLAKMHQRSLVHRDVNPRNILVNEAAGNIRLSGFGMASRLLRERQSPGPPEIISGTLAYMAPEQTGRMNRSIDSRTDLYALGVTFYRMLTGTLPFSAGDPIEWIHCHIAKEPEPPSERLKSIPTPVSAIVMKLLAKNAEERYQTAAGAGSDLEHCLVEWRAHACIADFQLGEQDMPDRLTVPEKLYGREQEVSALITAFDRVAKGGRAELALVSGYSGVGKSAVVNELQKVVTPPRGLFATGKFDQFKRDIPYLTFAQAFQNLIRSLLARTEGELRTWRDAFGNALGMNGQMMVDLVPDLKLIIGEQPPLPELPPKEARQRFEVVLRRFIGVFARPEHPLALFFEDLQWADTATLELLGDLLTQSELRNLLLIGSYRSNEVDDAHPLMAKLDAIRSAGAAIIEISLGPLSLETLQRLVADALRCEPVEAAALAQLTYNRTLGNPFFAIQFLTGLADEELIQHHGRGTTWQWSLDRIRARPHTDNVVDLMIAKMKRLPVNTQRLLTLLACMGSLAQRRTLEIAYFGPRERLEDALLDATRADLLLPMDGSYKFLHDRIQEAAYKLIDEKQRTATHVRIGRTLLAHLTHDEIAAQLFEIVNQLNHGIVAVADDQTQRSTATFGDGGTLFDRSERLAVAALNLRAARRAKSSNAYASACVYLKAGMALLAPDLWQADYELVFGLHLERAECEFLSGNPDIARRLIPELLERAASKVDQAAVYRLKIVIHVMTSEYQRAVESALVCLSLFGIEMPAHPSDEQVKSAYEEVWHNLGQRTIESLIDLPLMSNLDMLAAMAVLSDLSAPAHVTDVNLMRLNTCYLVNLSLKFGATSASTFGFAWFGVLLGPVFHRYGDGYRFGELAVRLAEKHAFVAHRAKVNLARSLLGFWSRDITSAVDFTGVAFQAALDTGDYTFACYSLNYRIEALLARGDHLDEVWKEAEAALAFARRVNFRDAADIIVGQQRLIQNMRGLTTNFSSYNDAEFEETAFEAQLTPDRMATMVCWYWVLKLQARFISGDFEAAVAAADKARALLWSSDAQIHAAKLCFYDALATAAICGPVGTAHRDRRLAALRAHLSRLGEWADNCAAIFGELHALVAAEVARVEQRELDAERLYEEAIRLARKSSFTQDEALCNELAGRFYSGRGFETIAQTYFRNARYCYVRWGALGKVKQLDEEYPLLREAGALPAGGGAIGAPLEYLDLATVIKLSQALSSEIVFEKLIQKLMTIAVEHAGADRGILILPTGDNVQIEAEATTRRDGIEVCLATKPAMGSQLPLTMLQYVLRTRESVVLSDAFAHNEFLSDDYIRTKRCRSAFCLPLLRQTRLIGVLYLENTLAKGAFSPARESLLKLLASQAAISLENSHLYRELAERERRIRRLVDANIIGIVIFDFEGRIIEANDTFLRMLQFERDDFDSGRVRWTDLIPPEWRDRAAQALEAVKTTGATQPFEREYLRKDGSRVPVLIGAASFEDGADEGVAFVLDLSERKRAERALRELQNEFAHANRVATMGQLAASIAHEISQPIAAVATNAAAAQRWLAKTPPNLDETRHTIEQIGSDARRATNIISGIRALFKKSAPRKDCFDLNEAVREISDLTGAEAIKHGVSLHTRLAGGLPAIEGDRVQLQQVMLNLVLNATEAMSGVDTGPRQLVIRTEAIETDSIKVAVEDSGPGLDPESFEMVFTPFHSSKPSGLGMGLSICRSIIESHGGRIWVSANRPRGAVFQFTIPFRGGSAGPLQSGYEQNPPR